jgi:hypothetical protein
MVAVTAPARFAPADALPAVILNLFQDPAASSDAGGELDS